MYIFSVEHLCFALYVYAGIIILLCPYIFLTVAIPYSSGLLGSGIGPVLYAYLNCIGNETSLSQCATLQSFPLGIGHFSDAGVRCLNASKYNMKNLTTSPVAE